MVTRSLPLSFDFSEFESISNTLDANFAPDQMMGLCGNLFINVWDNIMLDRNYYETTPNYSMFHNQILQGGAPKWGDGDPKQRALDLGFSSIVKSNRTYHVKKEKTLYYPKCDRCYRTTISEYGIVPAYGASERLSDWRLLQFICFAIQSFRYGESIHARVGKG
jgi:hypothetical protein